MPTPVFLAMVACAVSLFLALVAGVFLHLLYNYSRLSSIPGPFLASLSDFYRGFARRSSGYERHVAELHASYGSVVRLGPRIASLSDVGDIARACRGQLLHELSWYQTSLSGHQQMPQGEGAIDESLRSIMAKIRQHRDVHLTTSLGMLAEKFIFQFLSDHFTSNRRGHAALNLLPSAITQPPSSLFTILEEFLLRGPVSRLKRERFSCSTPGSDVSALMHADDSSRRTQEASPNDAFRESPVLAAGIETITRTFVSTFAILLQYPIVLARLRNQINAIPHLWDLTAIPRWRDLREMSYLDAVMKETMRYILLFNDHQDIALTMTLHISSFLIPPGMTLTWNPPTILGNSFIYGTDTNTFRPERWITPSPQHREMMNESLLPFSVCIETYPVLEAAWLELVKAVVVLVREFDIESLEDEERSDILGLESRSASSKLVRFTPRMST
ncbi:cytochrome P450 [Aspergillus californicus]